MSPRMFFFILLLVGALLIYLGKGAEKGKILLISIGILISLLGVFGIFTSFL